MRFLRLTTAASQAKARLAIAALAVVCVFVVAILGPPLLVAGLGGSLTGEAAAAPCAAPIFSGDLLEEPNGVAGAEIPPDYLAAYQQAGRDLDIDWRFLAAIGAQESNHGRSTLPGVHEGQNSAGAAGPMQLGNGTGAAGDLWGTYKLDGDADGILSVYAPWDAIYAAANGLRRGKGAPGRGGSFADYKLAAGRYFGSTSAPYSDEVMARAVRYGFPADGGADEEADLFPAPIAAEPMCAPADLEGVRAEIVSILRAELALGLKETSEDQGPPLDRYWGSSGIPWCAAFATWVWREAGVAIPKNAYSGYFMEWGTQAGTWRALGETPPKPGDALVWGDGDGDGKTDHVDIVESVLPDGRVVVIGGNVSDAVTRKAPFDPATARNSSGAPVLGYARPTTSAPT